MDKDELCCFMQDMYGWPDEPFEEMDSTLAVQQVTASEQLHFIALWSLIV